jgi:hypothetical protein
MERSRWPSTRSIEGLGLGGWGLGREVFQRCEDGVVVAIDLDGAPDFFDDAVGADEERGADDSHFLFAVHILFAPGAELLGDLVVRIGEERKVELELVLEFGVTHHVVGADAEYFCAELFQLGRAVAEGASLFGAAGSVVGRIEVEDDETAFEVGKLDLGSVVGGEGEGGGFGAFGEPVRHARVQGSGSGFGEMWIADCRLRNDGRGIHGFASHAFIVPRRSGVQ